jgi:hypothetical protein
MRIAKNRRNLANLYRMAATMEQEILEVEALEEEQEIEESNTVTIVLDDETLEVGDARPTQRKLERRNRKRRYNKRLPPRGDI